MAYPIGFWADLVRSTSSTSLLEDVTGIFVWLRTSDGQPLEQERFAAGRWFSVSDDTDEPDFIVRIGSSVNQYRFRKTGEAWLPNNNGIAINNVNFGGRSTFRFYLEPVIAKAEFVAGVPYVQAHALQEARAHFQAGVPRLTATALNSAKAEFRAGVPRVEAAALQSDVFAVFRAGVPRIRAQGLQLAAAQFRAGVPTARAIALRSAKAEFRAGVPRVMAFEDPAAEFRAGVPSVRAAALQTGAAEFRAGVPFVVARANIDEDITPLVPVVPPGPTPTPAPGNYVSIDRPDLHHTLRTLLDSGRSPDPATFQQFAQYLYSLGENVEELIRSGGTGTGTGTGTTPALPPDDEGGSERFFPFAYGLPYDNRNTVSAVTATGGAWLATVGGIAVQEPEAFPWETIDSLTFSRVDAEGVSRFPIYNAPEFRADGAALLLALRHEDEDGAETRVAYQMTGPIVSVPDGSWRFTVSRSETARMYDVGNYAAHNPLHNRNFPLRLLLPQVTQIRNFPTGRKPSWFFTQVSADIATKLEAIDANDEFPDDAVIAAEAILPTDPVPGDIVTLYRGTTVVSRGYTSDGRWSSIRLFIDGNLFVHGSIQTDALGANVVTAPKINVGKGLITGEDGQSLRIGVGSESGLIVTEDAIAIGLKGESGLVITEDGIALGLEDSSGLVITEDGVSLAVGGGLQVDASGNLVPRLGAGLSLSAGAIVAEVQNPLGGTNSISITGDKIALIVANGGGLEVLSGGVRVNNLHASVVTAGEFVPARYGPGTIAGEKLFAKTVTRTQIADGIVPEGVDGAGVEIINSAYRHVYTAPEAALIGFGLICVVTFVYRQPASRLASGLRDWHVGTAVMPYATQVTPAAISVSTEGDTSQSDPIMLWGYWSGKQLWLRGGTGASWGRTSFRRAVILNAAEEEGGVIALPPAPDVQVTTNTDYAYRRGTSAPSAPAGGTSTEVHTPAGWSRSQPLPTQTENVYRVSRTRTYHDGVFSSATSWSGVTKIADATGAGNVPSSRVEYAYILGTSLPSAPSGGTTSETHTPSGWSRSVLRATNLANVYRAERTLSFINDVFQSATSWGNVTKVEDILAPPVPTSFIITWFPSSNRINAASKSPSEFQSGYLCRFQFSRSSTFASVASDVTDSTYANPAPATGWFQVLNNPGSGAWYGRCRLETTDGTRVSSWSSTRMENVS